MIEKEYKVIMELNKPNHNNRIYTNEVVDEAIKEWNGKPLTGRIGMNLDNSLSHISHTVTDLRVEDDKLIGKITVLNTPEGKVLQDAINDMAFRPAGSADIVKQEDGTFLVKNYHIISINAVSKDTAA